MRTVFSAGLLLALGVTAGLAQVTDPLAGGGGGVGGVGTVGGGTPASGLDALEVAQFTRFESLGNGLSDSFGGGLFANGTEMVGLDLGGGPHVVQDEVPHIDLNRLLIEPARDWGRPQTFLLELISRHPIEGAGAPSRSSGGDPSPAAESSAHGAVVDQSLPPTPFDPRRWQRRGGPHDPNWRRRGGLSPAPHDPLGGPPRVLLEIPAPPAEDAWVLGGSAHVRVNMSSVADLVAEAAADVVRRRIAREIDPNRRSNQGLTAEDRANRARLGLILLDMLDARQPSDADREFLRVHRSEVLSILSAISQGGEPGADPIVAAVAAAVQGMVDWLQANLEP